MTNDDDKNNADGKCDVSQGEFAPQTDVDVLSASIYDLRHLAFRYMQNGFAALDVSGLHVDVNPAFCEMTGFSAAELFQPSEEQIDIVGWVLQ